MTMIPLIRAPERPTTLRTPRRPRNRPPRRPRNRRGAAAALALVAAAFACDGNPFAEGELAPRLSIALTGIDATASLQTVLDLADNLLVRAELPDGSVVEESFDFSTDQEVIQASLTLPIQGDQAEVTVTAQFRDGTEVVASASDQVVVRSGETNQAELALHPCDVPFLYTVGETASGELSASDCDFSHDYRFELTEQVSFIIQHGQESSSHGFLYATPSLAGSRTDAIGFIGDPSRYILSPGTYSVTVSYPGEGVTGPYEFALRPTSHDVPGCHFLYMTDGVRTSGTLDSDDCHSANHASELGLAEPLPSETFFTWLEAGETVAATISMQGRQTQAGIFVSRGGVVKVHQQVGSGELRLSHTAEQRDYHQVAVIGEPGASYSVAFETR